MDCIISRDLGVHKTVVSDATSNFGVFFLGGGYGMYKTVAV